MPTEKEVLTGLLSTAYQMDETGVASLYNEDGSIIDNALSLILEKDAYRIAALKSDPKKIFDDGYKKAQSETLSKFEKDLTTKYGLTSEKKGIELIEDLVTKFKSADGTDEEKVKKSRWYLDLTEANKQQIDEIVKAKDSEFENFKKQVENKERFSKVGSEALVIFESLKPILSEDAAKANNQRQVLLSELSTLNYDIRDNRVVLLDKDGGEMLDGHGNRVKFESYVKQVAEKYFDFYQADDKNAPTHKKTQQNNSVYKINSEADFLKLREEAKTPEERISILDAFNLAKQEGRI